MLNIKFATGFAELVLHPLQQVSVDDQMKAVKILGKEDGLSIPGRSAIVLVNVEPRS